jgi:hypothetical protein
VSLSLFLTHLQLVGELVFVPTHAELVGEFVFVLYPRRACW